MAQETGTPAVVPKWNMFYNVLFEDCVSVCFSIPVFFGGAAPAAINKSQFEIEA